jgi:hypothetical protein
MNIKPASPGQALLLILLIITVVTTVGLSTVSRSVSDISISTKQEESLRAFSAAEAGVEELLISNETHKEEVVDSTPDLPGEASYNADVAGFPESSSEYLYPLDVAMGDTATIWFVSHDDNGNILSCSPSNCFRGSRVELHWGIPGTDPSAVEVSLLYTSSGGRYSISRVAYDPRSRICSGCSPSSSKHTFAGESFSYRQRIDLRSDMGTRSSDTPILLKVRMLYNSDSDQRLAVNAIGGTLPAQGKKIESTGSSGDSNRKIRVFELYPDIPSIFDSAVFSATGIVK